MSRTAMIRSVAFGVVMAGGLVLGTDPARARAASRAPIMDSAEECRAYCIDYLHKGHYSWDPTTGACRCW